MVKRYKTASSRIELPLYEEFYSLCDKKGKTANEEIKDFIEREVNESRTQKTKRDIQGTDSKLGEKPQEPRGETKQVARNSFVNDID